VHNRINLLGLDLNLLPKFRALYRKRSVSAAARDLHVTQSAVSNALAKMRETFCDELFVRTTRGMEPTALAETIWESVGPALDAIEGSFERVQAFDPASSTRRFEFGVTAEAELCVIPELFAMLGRTAPRLLLTTCRADEGDGYEDLRDRRIDFFLGEPHSGAEIQSMTVAEASDVCVVNGAHPAVRTRDLASLRSSCSPVPAASLAGLLLLAASSDRAAIVPEALASRFAEPLGLSVFPDPFEKQKRELCAHWLNRRTTDAGMRWMVAQLARFAKGDRDETRAGRRARLRSYRECAMPLGA
jgi:DNA-binding transcriptional LysR family regulator